MKSLFEKEARQEIGNRIASLSPDKRPNWGTMDSGMMLKHCQGPLKVALGHTQLNTRISFFKRLMLKALKSTMYNDKPWKQQLPTAREFVIRDPQIFVEEKEKLLQLIDEFSQHESKTDWPVHPFFGRFTTAQWGKAQYKHLDHHLSQFGV